MPWQPKIVKWENQIQTNQFTEGDSGNSLLSRFSHGLPDPRKGNTREETFSFQAQARAGSMMAAHE